MEKHTKVYTEFFPTHNGFYYCEICHKQAHDIHHIIRRSEFGTKTKDQQDKIENLIALCRMCHEKAHCNIFTKEYLTEVHQKTIKIWE
ncbi:HNH endonuclease [Chryseobacterium nematophagum]|uniref:HNH endonuclease n=1 Tax=Chryseobacterium nematophagum TaxID=2305228 RepID=A0A3M7LDC2_9FLAO|nr:HNH endonuclease signature motif containing protein [Chryseobacterium nematophagum]RMZ60044.1 HNH endonuclease [Chryseobacterium nematophagum]